MINPGEATGISTIVKYTLPTATDNVDSSVTVICNVNSGTLFEFGDTTVTCSATDVAGNTATSSFIVTVQDTTSPVITVPDDITLNISDILNSSFIYYPLVVDEKHYGTATATDVSDVEITNNAPVKFNIGDTVIIWTATDSNGNESTASQTVTLVGYSSTPLTPSSNNRDSVGGGTYGGLG